MKQISIFCTFLLIFILGCGLLNEFANHIDKIIEPQITPNATSSQDIIITQISDLFIPEDDCLLPCFGGLRFGEANISDVQEFLEQFNFDAAELQLRHFDINGYGLSLQPESDGLALIDLITEDELLYEINISLSDVYGWLPEIPYALADVFRIYGEPDEIFILIAGPPTRFALVILYNEQGFMLRYRATYNESQLANNNEPLPICLDSEIVDLQQINVWLQSEDEIDLVENNQPDLREDREIRPWWTIQRMANVTMDEFVDFFVSNPEECFLLPPLTELREQGYTP